MSLTLRNPTNIVNSIINASTVYALREVANQLGEQAVRWLDQQIAEGRATSIRYLQNGLGNMVESMTNFMTPDVQPSQELTVSPPQMSLRGTRRFDDITNPQDSATSVSNWRRLDNIEMNTNTTEAAPMMLAARSAGPSTQQSGSTETPITPADPHYQYYNTETVKTNASIWCTVIRPAFQSVPSNITLGLNYPKNLFTAGTFQLATAGGAATAGAITNHNKESTTNFTNFDATLRPYPVIWVQNPPTITVQNWRNYVKQFQYYTVLNCRYKITMQNISTEISAPISVLYGFNTSSSTSIGTKFPTDSAYWTAKQWKGIQELIIPSIPNPETSKDGIIVLEGNYKPGQAERAIVNDGDVKRWTKIDGTDFPNYKEELFLMFFAGPFATNTNAGLRVQIEMEYIVQFKEPRQAFRYPNPLASNISINTVETNYTYA